MGVVYWRNVDEVEYYIPPGHEGTHNKRIVSIDDGMEEMEVIIGEIEPGGTADPHYHDDIEQSMYMISGNLDVIIGGEKTKIKEGDVVYIPKKTMHEVVNSGSEIAKFVLIYAPPLKQK